MKVKPLQFQALCSKVQACFKSWKQNIKMQAFSRISRPHTNPEQNIQCGYTPWEALDIINTFMAATRFNVRTWLVQTAWSCPSALHCSSDLCCEKWTISDPKDKSPNLQTTLLPTKSIRLGQSQVFTEVNERKGFQFLPTVLTHTASHQETLNTRQKVKSHSRQSSCCGLSSCEESKSIFLHLFCPFSSSVSPSLNVFTCLR